MSSESTARSHDPGGEKPPANARRSTRLAIAVPIVLSGRDAAGEQFREETRTISISRHGAAIATSHIIKHGAELVIANESLGVTARARAVRFTRDAASGAPHQVAVELESRESRNVWGIRYPPPDWRLPAAPPAPSQSPEQPTDEAPALAETAIEIDLGGAFSAEAAGASAGADIPASPPAASQAAPPESQPSAQEPDQPSESIDVASLALEVEARVEAAVQAGLARLEQRQSGFATAEESLGGVAKLADEAGVRLESLLSRTEEADRRAREQTDRARSELERFSGELVSSVTDKLGRMLSQAVETSAPSLLNDFKSQTANEAAAIFERLRSDISASLASSREEALSSSSRGLQEQQAQTIAETSNELNRTAQAAVEEALARMREPMKQIQESALQDLIRECLARSAAEIDAKRTIALEEIGLQASATTAAAQSGMDTLRTELEKSAETLRSWMLASLSQDLAAQSAGEIERTRAAASAQARDEIEQIARAVLERFQAQIAQDTGSTREAAAQTAAEIDGRRAQALEEMRAQASAATSSAQSKMGSLRTEFEQEAETLRSSKLAALSEDFAAQSAEEIEKARASTGAQAQDDLERIARSVIEGFQAHVERAITSAREAAAQSVVEIDGKRAQALGEIGAQASAATETAQSSLGALRAQLLQAAEELKKSSLAGLSQEFAAQSAEAVEKVRASSGLQAKEDLDRMLRTTLNDLQAQSEQSVARAQESSTRSAAEIEARRIQVLEEINAQAAVLTAVAEAAQSGIGTFRKDLEQAANALRTSTLAALSADFAAQSAQQIEEARAAAGSHVKDEIERIVRAGIDDFTAKVEHEGLSRRAEIAATIAGDCSARVAEELQARQSSAIAATQEQLHGMAASSIESIRNEAGSLGAAFAERTGELVAQSQQSIEARAEEVLSAARQTAEHLRKDVAESMRADLGAMIRGTLASMTEESKALTQEYREQWRESFEAFKTKSRSEIDSQLQGALAEGRETALRQVQKDAEDFSQVAVEQFRARSSEAVREALDAVHKQVGAAAFVIKDWQDQAAQRLESHMDRLKEQADGACAAVQDHSRRLSESMLQEFSRESEALILRLRQRMRYAADALAIEAAPPDGAAEQEQSAASSPEHTPAEGLRTPQKSTG
ncbi:MAG: hypothetical protein ACRD3D_05040 [Terriglobia bacterium]